MWPFKNKIAEVSEKTLSRRFEPTAEDRAEARANPGGWVYVIRGDVDPNGRVPPEAIAGAWKVDAKGELTGEFIPNPNYRGP
ncbi:MAG: hypothetical protein ACREO3_02050 [Arenimonas sp.]